MIGRRGFGSLYPWPSAQYRAYCLSAPFLLRGIRRAAPAQVTACRVVTPSAGMLWEKVISSVMLGGVEGRRKGFAKGFCGGHYL